MILYKRVVEKTDFKASPHNLLERLSAIRLSTFIESPEIKTKGLYKTAHRIEEIDEEMSGIANIIGLFDEKFKVNIPFGVYN